MYIRSNTHTHTHTHPFNGSFVQDCPGEPVTRKAKLIWILLKRETVRGSGISWAICKSAPCSRQITMPTPHHSVFYRPDALPATQPTVSKHWRHIRSNNEIDKRINVSKIANNISAMGDNSSAAGCNSTCKLITVLVQHAHDSLGHLSK